MPIYFVIASKRFVKIGFATDVKSRFKNISTFHYQELKLAAVADGDLAAEKALHRRFAEERVRGEWFRLSARLRGFIESLPRPDPSLIPTARLAGNIDADALARLITFLRLNERDVMYVPMIQPVMRDYLLSVAEVYRLANSMTLSAVSKRFYGNTKFLDRFREKQCSISLDQYEAVIDKFIAQWPRGLYFPKFPKLYIARPRGRRVINIPK